MLNPFKPPELIKAETLMSMPKQFRARKRNRVVALNRQGAEVDSFLEGPAFDRAGQPLLRGHPVRPRLPSRISTRQEWELVDPVRRLAQRA